MKKKCNANLYRHTVEPVNNQTQICIDILSNINNVLTTKNSFYDIQISIDRLQPNLYRLSPLPKIRAK